LIAIALAVILPPQPGPESRQRENDEGDDELAIAPRELGRLVLADRLVDLAHEHVLLGGQALLSIR